MKETKTTLALRVLLRDFGYIYKDGTLIVSRTRFFEERVIGHFRSLLAAAEYLCPIIHDGEYTDRLVAAEHAND